MLLFAIEAVELEIYAERRFIEFEGEAVHTACQVGIWAGAGQRKFRSFDLRLFGSQPVSFVFFRYFGVFRTVHLCQGNSLLVGATYILKPVSIFQP